MALPVTTIIAALAGLMLVGLGLLAGLRRNATRINLGTEGDDVLLKRVRAHGNSTEYTPIALILLALAEVAGTSATYLWIAGGLLLAGRALHAIGLIATILPARAVDMLMTFGAILYMIWLLLF